MRILVADDHDLVREMIAEVLSREEDIDVATATSAHDVLERLTGKGEAFDLILLDYHMPGMNELEGLEHVMKAAPGTPVALLSGVASKSVAEKALAAGAAGFLPKTIKAKSLVHAVRFLAAGETFVPVSFLAADDGASEAARARKLSDRELDVLRGLCEGLSNKEIAIRLDLQEVTVKLHVKTLTRKLGARNRTHAAMIAKDEALLD